MLGAVKRVPFSLPVGSQTLVIFSFWSISASFQSFRGRFMALRQAYRRSELIEMQGSTCAEKP